MLISRGHNVGFVTHDFHDGFQVGASHAQTGSESVPEVMKAETHFFVFSSPALFWLTLSP